MTPFRGSHLPIALHRGSPTRTFAPTALQRRQPHSKKLEKRDPRPNLSADRSFSEFRKILRRPPFQQTTRSAAQMSGIGLILGDDARNRSVPDSQFYLGDLPRERRVKAPERLPRTSCCSKRTSRRMNWWNHADQRARKSFRSLQIG